MSERITVAHKVLGSLSCDWALPHTRTESATFIVTHFKGEVLQLQKVATSNLKLWSLVPRNSDISSCFDLRHTSFIIIWSFSVDVFYFFLWMFSIFFCGCFLFIATGGECY